MLSSNKLNYIEGVQKHAKCVATTTIVLSVIVLTILIVIHTIINHKQLTDIIYNPFFSVIVLILSFFFFILYRGRQRTQRLQELIEQMSEEEFQFLLQAQSSLSFYGKYAPTFVICRDRLYLFTLFEIKEIDPKKVEKVGYHYARGGSFLVEIQSPETAKFEVYSSVYPYFTSLIEMYNPNAYIEKYE